MLADVSRSNAAKSSYSFEQGTFIFTSLSAVAEEGEETAFEEVAAAAAAEEVVAAVDGGQPFEEVEATEAPMETAENGLDSEPAQWQARLQSAVSAAVETRAGDPLALIAHLLRHAPPSSEGSAAEYAARHGLPAALEAAVRRAGLEGAVPLPAATDRLADAIASEQLRRTRGAPQRPGSPGGAADEAAHRARPSRQRQRRRLPEALEELEPQTQAQP